MTDEEICAEVHEEEICACGGMYQTRVEYNKVYSASGPVGVTMGHITLECQKCRRPKAWNPA